MGSCDLCRDCAIYIEDYSTARQQAACQNQVLPQEGSLTWKNPKRGRYMLDVDYAVDEENSKGGVGAIVRDEHGSIVFAMAKVVIKSATVLHGELKAVMHGICQCVADGISPIEAFTNSMLAIHVIAEEDATKSVLYEEMFDFFACVKELNVLSIGHVRREANMTAHSLASLAKTLNTTCMWYEKWSAWLLHIATSDSS